MGSLVDPPRGSTDEVRALPAFRTNGTVISHGARHPTSVGFDIQAEVDLVSIDLVRKLSLKNTAHRHQDSINLVAANQLAIQTYGTYTLRLELADHHGKIATTLRTYVAVKRMPDEPEVLLGMPGLAHSQIIIDTAHQQWEYYCNPRVKIIFQSSTIRILSPTTWLKDSKTSSLLSMRVSYRRFIRNSSAIVQPLTGLLKGSIKGRKSGDLSHE